MSTPMTRKPKRWDPRASIPHAELVAAEARVRMMAAAPDLLAALRFILSFYEPQSCLDTNAWKQAEASGRAAIAKATGEAA